MTRCDKFVFKSYAFDAASKQLSLQYGFDDAITYIETYVFDFDFVDYDAAQLDRALQNLFFMAGVSYYKAFASTGIVIKMGSLSADQADFFARTYQRGLGEFYFVNQLDLQKVTPFVATDDQAKTTVATGKTPDGLLVGLGGGKDSLVSIELLRQEARVATWSLGHYEQLQPLIAEIGLPHLQVSRQIDPLLLEHNAAGALNGHIPISAILACVGTVVGILAGYSTAVVSNENSANEPTLEYNGVAINHQYSKSLAFEVDYQSLLTSSFGDSLRYFSLLRPLGELLISELFAKSSFETYKATFSSCNRAFTQSSTAMSWCGECPKCAFVFLALTPFVERSELKALWGGKNLLLADDLITTYKELLGIEGSKPLECVGEIAESRMAMRLAQDQYPQLRSYEFTIADDYDFRGLAEHTMPDKYYDLLLASLPGRPNNIIE